MTSSKNKDVLQAYLDAKWDIFQTRYPDLVAWMQGKTYTVMTKSEALEALQQESGTMSQEDQKNGSESIFKPLVLQGGKGNSSSNGHKKGENGGEEKMPEQQLILKKKNQYEFREGKMINNPYIPSSQKHWDTLKTLTGFTVFDERELVILTACLRTQGYRVLLEV